VALGIFSHVLDTFYNVWQTPGAIRKSERGGICSMSASLAEALFAKVEEAAHLVPVERMFDGWRPRVGDCHGNAETIARLDPHYTVVRGWLHAGGYGGAIFNAHSVVADENGTLLDFTPADSLVTYDRRRFIRHPGSEEEFRRIVIEQKHAQIYYVPA
jgi:hypothetical protein